MSPQTIHLRPHEPGQLALEPRGHDAIDEPVHVPARRGTQRRESVRERHARQCTDAVDSDLLDSTFEGRAPSCMEERG